jgi:predicted nuclease of predicted toxin-antitoxin system
MKLLVDMNLSPLWVPFLAEQGIEAVHWSVVGPASAPDFEILDYADLRGYVIFTHDLDFGALLARRKASRPSVIQLRSQEVLPSRIGNAILRAIQATDTYLEQGALVTVDPTNQRIGVLPI